MLLPVAPHLGLGHLRPQADPAVEDPLGPQAALQHRRELPTVRVVPGQEGSKAAPSAELPPEGRHPRLHLRALHRVGLEPLRPQHRAAG